jgi:hypothetical protein
VEWVAAQLPVAPCQLQPAAVLLTVGVTRVLRLPVQQLQLSRRAPGCVLWVSPVSVSPACHMAAHCVIGAQCM